MSTITKQHNMPPVADGSVQPGYKRTEAGVIPTDWDVLPLGKLFTFKNGLNKAKQFFGFGTPIVNYMDVYKRPGLTMGELIGRVSLTPQEIKNFDVQKGDVFFTRTSETVEEIGVSSVMLEDPCDTVFSGFILRARPKNDCLDDQYKKYCFAIRSVRTQIVSKSTYTTRALTNGHLLSAVLIARPTIEEQRAIAAALSDVDELIGALEKLITKKRAFKLAAMQQLLTGKKTRLPGFEDEWVLTKMGSIGSTYCGLSGKNKLDFGTGNALYVPFLNVLENVCIDTAHLEYVVIDASESQNRVLEGDLLFNGTSETPGDLAMGAVLKTAVPDLYLNSFCFGFRIYDPKEHDGLFLAYLFKSFVGRGVMYALAQGATRYNMSKKQFLNLKLELPPAEEQRAIATVLSDMDAEIAALEQRSDKTKAIKQGMMQVLLTGRVLLVTSRKDV